jgi:hypothetical protein
MTRVCCLAVARSALLLQPRDADSSAASKKWPWSQLQLEIALRNDHEAPGHLAGTIT